GHRPVRSPGSGGGPGRDGGAAQPLRSSTSPPSAARRAIRAPHSQSNQITTPSTPPSGSPHSRWSVKKASSSVSRLMAGSLPQGGGLRENQRHRSLLSSGFEAATTRLSRGRPTSRARPLFRHN